MFLLRATAATAARSQRPTGPGAMISAVTASSSSVIAAMMSVSAASPAISNTNSADGGATVTPLGGGVYRRDR